MYKLSYKQYEIWFRKIIEKVPLVIKIFLNKVYNESNWLLKGKHLTFGPGNPIPIEPFGPGEPWIPCSPWKQYVRVIPNVSLQKIYFVP